MFKKKKCPKCGEKFPEKYNFCPSCGTAHQENQNEEDWGMLGKSDFINSDPFKTEIRLPLGFNTLFNTLVKSLDKQFKEIDKEIGKEISSQKKPQFKNSGGISISISSFGNQPPKINVKSFGNIPEFQKQEQQIKQIIPSAKTELSKEKLKKLSTLPREEPSTNIRRLSNKVIYEIELPGVKSKEDISTIQLENSIEIKAVSKTKAYFKLIPISLPIKSQKFSKEKLILELEVK